jgi:hypothetical protein
MSSIEKSDDKNQVGDDNQNSDSCLMWTTSEPREPPPGYCTSLLVWPSAYLRDDNERKQFQTKEFKEFFPNTKHEPVVIGNVRTLPGQGGPGGRRDLFFWVHGEDLPHFVMARFKYGIRWWQDVYFNGGQDIYPIEFCEAYPNQHWDGNDSDSETESESESETDAEDDAEDDDEKSESESETKSESESDAEDILTKNLNTMQIKKD